MHPACRSSGTLKPKRLGAALSRTGLCEGQSSIPYSLLRLSEVTEPCSTSTKKPCYNGTGKTTALFSVFSAHKQMTEQVYAGQATDSSVLSSCFEGSAIKTSPTLSW